jgi:hypothetical protein
MDSIGVRRFQRARASLVRILAALSLLGVLLIDVPGAASMSLVATHAPGGVIHTMVASSAGDQDVVVSRSVGLMEGAKA